jgi:hypothetical protein
MCTWCHPISPGLNLFLHNNNTLLLINVVPFKVISLGLYTVTPVLIVPFNISHEVHCLKLSKCMAWIMVTVLNLHFFAALGLQCNLHLFGELWWHVLVCQADTPCMPSWAHAVGFTTLLCAFSSSCTCLWHWFIFRSYFLFYISPNSNCGFSLNHFLCRLRPSSCVENSAKNKHYISGLVWVPILRQKCSYYLLSWAS